MAIGIIAAKNITVCHLIELYAASIFLKHPVIIINIAAADIATTGSKSLNSIDDTIAIKSTAAVVAL